MSGIFVVFTFGEEKDAGGGGGQTPRKETEIQNRNPRAFLQEHRTKKTDLGFVHLTYHWRRNDYIAYSETKNL